MTHVLYSGVYLCASASALTPAVRYRGEWPLGVSMLTSAPCSNSKRSADNMFLSSSVDWSLYMLAIFTMAAKRMLIPSPFTSLTSAPAFNNKVTISVLPLRTATNSGYMSFKSGSQLVHVRFGSMLRASTTYQQVSHSALDKQQLADFCPVNLCLGFLHIPPTFCWQCLETPLKQLDTVVYRRICFSC